MTIAVIDGQGGGLGRTIVEKLCAVINGKHEIIALGTNALATSAMLRAGAGEGATGENAIKIGAAKVDIIVGAIGILSANSMLGEVTPVMAEAIGSSGATKVLVPLNRCGIIIAGLPDKTVSALIDDAISTVRLMTDKG